MAVLPLAGRWFPSSGTSSHLQDIGLFPLILTCMLRCQITIGFTATWEPANGWAEAFRGTVSELTPQI